MIYLTREGYESYLRALNPDDPGLVESFREDYPLRTGAAASELRERGIDVNRDGLKYLAVHGICTPTGGGAGGGEFRWTCDQVDMAAAHLASKGRLTPAGQFCAYANLDFGQFQAALLAAGREISGIAGPGSVTQYKIVVHPGRPGAGIPGRIEFLAPDEGESE